jgi:hypothetical protein
MMMAQVASFLWVQQKKNVGRLLVAKASEQMVMT